MPLLSDIQQDILEGKPLAAILLKLRFLASRLGSDALEDWVRFEIDGYGNNAEVPPYRLLGVTYTASFIGIAGSQMKNAPVPPALIEKFASKDWLQISERQSISAIENLIASLGSDGGSLHIDASNLVLLLQGKIFPGMNCISARGSISAGSVVALLGAVRSRVLELTIQMEKSAPIASTVTFGKSIADPSADAGNITTITNQIVYGNLTSISHSSQISVDDSSQNKTIKISEDKLISEVHQALTRGNVDADELAKITEALNVLRSAPDKRSRQSAYNHFVSICADHIGIISPFIEPLKNMFLA